MVWRDGQAVSAAQVAALAGQLAARLPDTRHALNLCVGRLNFLVSLLAAGLRRQITLLPYSPLPAVIADLQKTHPSLHTIDDGCLAGLDWQQHSAHAISLPAAAPAVTLHTSGTTGAAQAHTRSWRELCAIAGLDGERLLRGRSVNLVASVPSQHMYGLQTAALLPLFGACAIHDSRPFFPGDIAAALAGLPAPRALITTPVHLRACLAGGAALPPLQFVLSATATLDRDLALGAERAWDTEVMEILGSTETATIGTRRTTSGSLWQLLPGARLEEGADHSVLHTQHLATPVPMADLLRSAGPGYFEFLGRAADQVKIAGKRASLAELTRQLLATPGVSDGVVFLPPGAQRTAALAVAAGRSAGELLDALAQRVDAAFLPRPLRIVAQLPRSSLGKLSQGALLDALRQSAAPNGGGTGTGA